MKIDILTLFPEMFAPLKTSIIGRAVDSGKLEINVYDIRNYTLDKHKKCDDTPFGGGAGAGVSVQPVGFLLVGDSDIRFQVVDHNAIYDRLIDEVPQMVEKLAGHKKEVQKENLAEQMVQVLQDSMQDK